MTHRPWGTTRAVVAFALLGASCTFRPRPDPTRFYVLPASVPDDAHAAGSVVVGLGPITFPGYLQHPTMATVDGTRVRYAEFDRWAEPLPVLFARALGHDLSALLDARIVPYPWYHAARLDVVVRVDVSAFEADGAGHATLDACWSVQDRRSTTVRRDECASIAETVDERSAQARVYALGRAVSELARRLATAVRP
jgi:uncharacterized lipoprotein YmbA